MHKHFLLIIIVLSGLYFSGCKSSYEKIRTSNDPNAVLKAADKYYDEKDYLKAQGLYELVLTSFRGQKEAEDIYFKYAYTHYYLSEFETASHLFKTFSNTFINSYKREEAEFLSVYSIYKTSPAYRLDQSGTLKAIDGFQLFANTYPTSSRLAECNTLIDEMRSKLEYKTFEQGKLYYDMKSYQSCVTVLENLLLEFPESKNHREIRYLIVKSSFELAQRSIFEKQKERYIETIQRADHFIQKYGSGKWSSDVKEIKNKSKSILKNTDYERYKESSAGN